MVILDNDRKRLPIKRIPIYELEPDFIGPVQLETQNQSEGSEEGNEQLVPLFEA